MNAFVREIKHRYIVDRVTQGISGHGVIFFFSKNYVRVICGLSMIKQVPIAKYDSFFIHRKFSELFFILPFRKKRNTIKVSAEKRIFFNFLC